ncbi:MAG TPA: DNA-binding response regulator [Bdellovibrionales bacterium]|nr:DNA-binding response regulator [Pseudobdellovibrionaceae bacterium]HAG90933.1 DNA-binding response regulator [Bdellovibrionales bacterium]|tara:strand:- start:4595 stop:5347 length:753 start_codon:yes stop_codon:yes gene_type:complete
MFKKDSDKTFMEAKKRVLLVEDGKDHQMIIKASLGSEFDLTCVETGQKALEVLVDESFHLVITDIMLPDIDGFEVCKEIRKDAKHSHLPVIFISSKKESQDKLLAFALGANDYVVKPFDMGELLARVKANIHRPHSTEDTEESESIRLAPFELSTSTHRVFIDRQDGKDEILLTKTELLIFQMFLGHPDRVYSRAQILEKVWGSDVSVTDRTVDTHISKLRTKLKPFGSCIEPVHGFGYRLNLKKIQKAA